MSVHDDLATLGRLLAKCVSADQFGPELARVEAEIERLTQERDKALGQRDDARAGERNWQARAEAAEAALAEAKADAAAWERAAIAHGTDIERLRLERNKAEAALADMRRALGAYRSALRSGEPETPQLREMGDRALAATDSDTNSEGRGNQEHLSSAKAAAPPGPENGLGRDEHGGTFHGEAP